MTPMGSRFNINLRSHLTWKLLFSYVWLIVFGPVCQWATAAVCAAPSRRPSIQVYTPPLVCVRACIFVCVQSEVALSCTRQDEDFVQQKHFFMLLQLICIAVMGTCCPTAGVWCSRSGHPDKFVFTMGVRLCVLPFSPSYADFLSQSCLLRLELYVQLSMTQSIIYCLEVCFLNVVMIATGKSFIVRYGMKIKPDAWATLGLEYICRKHKY